MRGIHASTLGLLVCFPLWAACDGDDTGSTENENQGSGGNSGSAAVSGSKSAGAGGKSAAGSGSGVGGRKAFSYDSDGGIDPVGVGPVGTQGGDGTFESCVAALKPSCRYDDLETPCAALTTASVPLTDGSTWGGTELKQGPYGSFVDWNEGSAFANPISAAESSCAILAGAFGEPASVTADVLNLRDQDLGLYTIFRPACMKDGEKYPVITWGNGTCGQSGGYASLLATVASYGYVVIASNSRFTDAGNKEMLKALDFAKAANEDPESILHDRLDLDNVGAMGHSQGSSATAHVASDPRIKSVILWNAGTSASKPFLAVSGERDITGYTAMEMATALDGADQPGAWLFYHQILQTGGNVTGHLTLMEQPERVTGAAIAWWDYWLKGDKEAKKQFVGDKCGLCSSPDDYEYGQRNLP